MNLEISRQTFTAEDGETLQYKSWLPHSGFKQSMVLLHRGHEHADRWDEVVPGLALEETAIFAWEARGHGQSPGKRGHANGFMAYVRDLESFMLHLQTTYGVERERVALIAHSVGAVVAATWVHDYAPPLAALVLATPAFEVNLMVPGALTGIRLMQKVKPDSVIKSYVRGHWLTRDLEQQKIYDADTSISKDISARVLVDLFDTAKRVVDDAAVMETPMMLLSAGDDQVVLNSALSRFLFNYGGDCTKHVHLPGARHAIFHDVCRNEVVSAVREFVAEKFAEERVMGVAVENRFTRSEYEELQKPLKPVSLKAANYEFQKGSMQTLGKLSKGIKLGWEVGFDSGQSLDYVYENKAQGVGPIGKLIDRGYLDAIGWKGIRQRRGMMRKGLDMALEKTAEAGLPRTLVDIAGGGGRYLMDVLKERTDGLQVLCRDWSEGALEVGRSTAKEWGLEERIRFEKGDAFDEESLAQIQPAPAVAVVSGLYELFPSNELLQRSLRGLNRAVPVGGWLVYTNQPWHPQVEMIARVLVNRDGKPWIMRRRPQGEMDALVSDAGFEKVTQWTDDFGIFTVAVAKKVG
ncbi:alpha/beta fold hydrolase [Phragmitibacter flavus]|uniref:Alpha/beta fold hydrolase n=1 Tax=Phragmitibacter flavus TaxID=2576071 RepID=A0A5R8KJD4_9BACT|nr:bifunctional alpha/beta hydrolase/class I SAM-dependent methyltransferase [Phragmitibacter flavus]TLD72438.1 alpha/beta fold hydrolase [Phragmitibacter flavus]